MAGYWERVANNQILSRRKMLSLAGGGVIGTALLAACGDDEEPEGGGEKEITSRGTYTPSDGPPQSGGRFAYTLTTINSPHFNPITDVIEGLYIGGPHIYDRPLTTREDERRYVLEAMESIELSDPLTVRMKLKAGQTFHDIAPVNGRPVKASDIVATQEYIKAEPRAFDKTFANGYLQRMETPEENTIVFHLRKPNAYLFGMGFLGSGTGQPIVPAETLTSLTTSRQIGSGPYISDAAEFTPTGRVFRKNPKWRETSKGLPYMGEREYKFLPDPVTYEAAFRSGQVDLSLYTSPRVMNTLEKDFQSKSRLYRVTGIDHSAMHWNMTQDFPWKDIRVREAIWRLTDRKQMLELVDDNAGELQSGLIPPVLKEYQLEDRETAPYRELDAVKARQLLSAANWDPTRRIKLLGNAQDDRMTVYQQQLSQGGIDSEIDTYASLPILFQRLGAGSWEVFSSRAPGSGDPYIPLRSQHTDSWSPVFKGFALMDKEVDAAIDKAEATLDHEENVKLVKDIQLMVFKKYSSTYVLYTLQRNHAFSTRVQNWELTLALPLPQHDAWLKG